MSIASPALATAVVVALTAATAAAAGGPVIQGSATSVRPTPATARNDASPAVACQLAKLAVRPRVCVYGDPHGSTKAVLFGDSHALQWFTAADAAARARGWRLLLITKSACPAALVEGIHLGRPYTQCDRWRAAALRRISRIHPTVVLAGYSGGTGVWQHGKRVPGGARRRRALATGVAAMARRLRSMAGHVVVMHDVPRPPWDEPTCVGGNMAHLRRCAFPRRPAVGHPDLIPRVLRGLRRVTVADPVNQLCTPTLCPAVIDDVLVYRQQGHLTATFAATLEPWLDGQLARIAPAGR